LIEIQRLDGQWVRPTPGAVTSAPSTNADAIRSILQKMSNQHQSPLGYSEHGPHDLTHSAGHSLRDMGGPAGYIDGSLGGLRGQNVGGHPGSNNYSSSHHNAMKSSEDRQLEEAIRISKSQADQDVR